MRVTMVTNAVFTTVEDHGGQSCLTLENDVTYREMSTCIRFLSRRRRLLVHGVYGDATTDEIQTLLVNRTDNLAVTDSRTLEHPLNWKSNV